MRVLDRLQPLGLLALRLVVGFIMVGHSYPKLLGGMHKYEATISALGLPWWLALVSAAAEFFGGLALIFGIFTRCFSLAILIDMVIAIWKVHWKNGFMKEHGYEFPLTLAAVVLSLIFSGAGPITLDAVLRGSSGAGFSGRKSR